MKKGHGNSRRQAYGRRMKDLRSRRATDVEVDLQGPDGWNRGAAWDDEGTLRSSSMASDSASSGMRHR